MYPIHHPFVAPCSTYKEELPLLQVCQVTLQLFDVLLQAPLPSIVQEMVLRHWWGGGTPLLITPPHQLASERQKLEETITASVPHTDSIPRITVVVIWED